MQNNTWLCLSFSTFFSLCLFPSVISLAIVVWLVEEKLSSKGNPSCCIFWGFERKKLEGNPIWGVSRKESLETNGGREKSPTKFCIQCLHSFSRCLFKASEQPTCDLVCIGERRITQKPCLPSLTLPSSWVWDLLYVLRTFRPFKLNDRS